MYGHLLCGLCGEFVSHVTHCAGFFLSLLFSCIWTFAIFIFWGVKLSFEESVQTLHAFFSPCNLSLCLKAVYKSMVVCGGCSKLCLRALLCGTFLDG